MNATPLSRRLATGGSIVALLVWGVLFIYLYVSGRIQLQVTPKFQLFALAAGFGMCVLALFNLLTLKVKSACCHDHAEEGHDHAHDHGHGHGHDGCCGHDHHHHHHHGDEKGHDHDHDHGHAAKAAHSPEHHAHDHAHDNAHEHEDCCGGHGHDHHHHHSHEPKAEKGHAHAHAHSHDHDHDHDHGCCGHDHHEHEHDHGHAHGKTAAGAAHSHAHAHDHESPPGNVMIAVLILLVPVLMAARISPEKFSTGYVIKWDTIDRMIRRQNAQQRLQQSPETPGSPDAAAVAKAGASAADTPPAGQTSGEGQVGSGADTVAPAGEAKKEGEWQEFSLADLERMVPRSTAGNFTLDIVQIFYTTSDREVRKVLAGQPVETTAQVMPEKLDNPEGKRLRLFQLYVECCAADARPISVPIEFAEQAPPIKENGWAKVTGVISYYEEDGEVIPLITVNTMEEAVEPKQELLY